MIGISFRFEFQRTFHYNSHFWSDKNTYNLTGGKTGFDQQETKLPTYWSTPFSKICLGMKIGHQINFLTINRHANSLYSLIADGTFRHTSLGTKKWKTLIGLQGSLQQTGCDEEGFNVFCGHNYSKARIGTVGNDQKHCSSGCRSKNRFWRGRNAS